MTDARIPPQDLEAEKSVIGAMLISGAACDEALKILSPDDFYREANRNIFRACASIRERKEPVDIITITHELKLNGDLERVGSVSGLTDLIENLPTAANVEYYALIVREKATARSLIGACTQIVGEAYRGDKHVQELLKDAGRILTKTINDSSTFKDFDDSIKNLVVRTVQLLKDNWEGRANWFVKTGFKQFDYFVGGLERKKLILITGDPCAGKSTVCQQLAVQIAQSAVPVLYYIPDVTEMEIPLRLACTWAGLDYRELQSHDSQVMTDKKKRDAIDALEMVSHLTTMFIAGQEQIGTKFDTFEDWVRRRVREQGVKAVFVDSAAKFDLDQQHGETTERAMAKIVKRLVNMAIELDVAMVVIHETNQGEDKNPKHTGEWRYASRYWFHVVRDQQNSQNLELVVKKNSNGPNNFRLLFRQANRFKISEDV
jgi:replicative DNA helicase